MRLFLTLLFMGCFSLAQAETLTWTANTTVSSYKVYHRLSTESDYGPGVSAVSPYATGTLSPGTHVFAVTALDATGKESVKSDEVFKVIPLPDPRLDAMKQEVCTLTTASTLRTALRRALGGC